MHLGFITPEYPHPRVKTAAGMGTSIKNLVVTLTRKNITVSLFIYGQDEDAIIEADGAKIHLIKNKTYPFGGWYLHRKYINRYVNTYIDSDEIQAIEAPDWTGITAFMNFKIPLVIRFHGSDTYFCNLEGRAQKAKNKFLEKQALKIADHYIAPTTYAGTETAKLFGIHSKRVKTIHYGLDLSKFINTTPEKFESYRLVNVGTVIRKKGVFQLAEAFNKLVALQPKATLYFIGSDSGDIKTGSASTWEIVEATLTPEAKKRTTYLGKVNYEDVQKHLKEAHVCVFPSLAETLGMVTIESMALQKVVVNTNYGWAQELIDHEENGFLIDPNAIDAYVQTIEELFNDIPRCILLGSEARKKIENTFDSEEIVKKNIKFYKEVIA
ncbi:glycosyltransferase family 4 protein [Dokdonia ponticola]|uniref:Glycosyltransferase family 4 protein n=1 Tax=Dokdonia ponticola TaxID=2041041 RepID=A0ABV9I2F8_9FLAO